MRRTAHWLPYWRSRERAGTGGRGRFSLRGNGPKKAENLLDRRCGSIMLVAKQRQCQKEGIHAGLLPEVPAKERHARREADYAEERPPGHPGRLPRLRHEDVPHRQEVSRLPAHVGTTSAPCPGCRSSQPATPATVIGGTPRIPGFAAAPRR